MLVMYTVHTRQDTRPSKYIRERSAQIRKLKVGDRGKMTDYCIPEDPSERAGLPAPSVRRGF